MTEPEQHSDRTGVASALGAAAGVSVLQALTSIVVFLLFWGAADSASEDSLDGLDGIGYIFVGLLVTPAVALIVGTVFAWRLRLRLFGLYALAPLISVGVTLGSLQAGPVAILWLAALSGLAWNLLVGASAGRKLSLLILSLMIVK